MKAELIIKIIADYFNATPDQIISATRAPNKIYKHIAIYMCTKYSVCSYETLASDFGLKSKGSIAYSVRRVHDYGTANPGLRVKECIESIGKPRIRTWGGRPTKGDLEKRVRESIKKAA